MVTLPDPAGTSRFDQCAVTFRIVIKALLMLELFPQRLSIMPEMGSYNASDVMIRRLVVFYF